jgi:hypothetical protein
MVKVMVHILTFFLVVVGFELRALLWLGNCLFLVIFQIRVSHLYSGLPGPRSSCLFLPCSWDDRDTSPHLALLVKMGCANFSSRLSLNHDLVDLYLPSSWDYQIEQSHLAFFFCLFLRLQMCTTSSSSCLGIFL